MVNDSRPRVGWPGFEIKVSKKLSPFLPFLILSACDDDFEIEKYKSAFWLWRHEISPESLARLQFSGLFRVIGSFWSYDLVGKRRKNDVKEEVKQTLFPYPLRCSTRFLTDHLCTIFKLTLSHLYLSAHYASEKRSKSRWFRDRK